MLSSRILYIILLLSSSVFVFFHGGTIPFTIFFIFLFLPLVSVLYTIVIISRFKYSQEIDNKFIVKGDRVNYSFIISNEDYILYPYLKVAFFGSDTVFSEDFKDIDLFLAPRSTREFNIELDCRYSGRFEIGASKVFIEDFFGIYKFTYAIPFPLTISVYPRVVPLQRFNLEFDFSSEALAKTQNRDDESGTFRDIRKYAYGDSLKKIHWNLSAKLNEIMVRQFQNTTDSGAVIIPDFKKNHFGIEENAAAEDKITESAISIAHYCLGKNIPVNMVCYSQNLMEYYSNDLSGFSDIYDCVSNTKFSQEITFPDITSTYIKSKEGETNLVLITADLSYALYDVLHKAVLSGFHTIVVYISTQSANGEEDTAQTRIIQNIPKTGAVLYKINQKDDIKTVLEAMPV